MTRKKVVKRKLEIVFDPEKRREFLTGFRKRKNERRKRAQEELERNLKEERKRIRQEINNDIKHMKKSFEPLRELTEEDKACEDEYEDDDVKVKIVEVSTSELAARNNLLGENRIVTSPDPELLNNSDDEGSEGNANCIPGMNLSDDTGTRNERYDKNERKEKPNELRHKKELDRLKKTKILKREKNSKVFKQKERIQKLANQKKAKRAKNNTLRSLPKHQRIKKKAEASLYNKGRLINKKRMLKKRNN